MHKIRSYLQKAALLFCAAAFLLFPLNACSLIKLTEKTTESAFTAPDIHENANSSPDLPAVPDTSPPEDSKDSRAMEILRAMTLEEKIGQLFIVRLESPADGASAQPAQSSGVIQLDASVREMLNRYHPGGVILFSKNIRSPEQLKTLTTGLQGEGSIPLFIGVDEEGGQIARIANSPDFHVPKYTSMQTIGKTKDPRNAFQAGLTIGNYLRDYGFNTDFAPVADVNSNPKNIVIGNRSFGSDPVLVAEMVQAEINGLHQAGIISCIKHFPGHGNTVKDTHDGYVSIQDTWEELMSCALIPFIRTFEKTDMVMVAHITTPGITSDGLPASLSHEMIQGKLRGELGYRGVVITDSLEMGAIADAYSPAESAVAAISAGADILLMPEELAKAYEGLYQAVKNGTLSETRIDESVLRILALKERYKLLK